MNNFQSILESSNIDIYDLIGFIGALLSFISFFIKNLLMRKRVAIFILILGTSFLFILNKSFETSILLIIPLLIIFLFIYKAGLVKNKFDEIKLNIYRRCASALSNKELTKILSQKVSEFDSYGP